MRVITFLIPLNNAYSAPDKQVAEFLLLKMKNAVVNDVVVLQAN